MTKMKSYWIDEEALLVCIAAQEIDRIFMGACVKKSLEIRL